MVSALLQGKVACVTGGGAGIGGAIARRFHEHGATVEIAEIDADRVAAIADDGTAGLSATHTDVTDAVQVDQWARRVLDTHGRVDVLVNNVGHYVRPVPFRQSTPDHWAALHNINLHHVFLVTRAFTDAMVERAAGSIINIHSVEGLRGYPPDPVYAAYKAAVAHFTTSLAGELGRKGIRVNGIAPDLTQTPQVDYAAAAEPGTEQLWEAWAPLGRIGTTDEQADVALFLASDLSRFVTGANIPVDGGTHGYGGWFWSPGLRRFTNRPPQL